MPPPPGRERLRELLVPPFPVRSFALTGLLVLACFYTLSVARAFLLPVVMAFLLSLLLSPLVRALRRLRIPERLGSLVVLLVLVGTLGFAVVELAGPALEWMGRAPGSMRRLEEKLRELKAPVAKMSAATERVEKMARVEGGTPKRQVEVAQDSLAKRLFANLWSFAADTMITLILLYFLLASGDLFLRKLIRVLPTRANKVRAVEIARQVESEVSAYLGTVTLICLGEGTAVGLATWLLGMPNPVLWGVMAALLAYVPYVGAMVGISTTAVVALLTFQDTGRALLVPLAYLAINLTQAYVVSPLALGRRLTLNPVAIFLALIFWAWMWGVVGALIAVPLLVIFKILCDHSERLAPIGEFLGS